MYLVKCSNPKAHAATGHMLVTSLAARAEDEGAFLAVQYGFVAIAQKYAASDEDLERKQRQLDMLKE